MKEKKIIPCIYLCNKIAVKGLQDRTLVDADPLSLAKFYENNGADALLVFDMSDSDGPTAVFSTEAEYIPAGTVVNAMPVRHKQEMFRRFSEALDIQFIFEDKIPWVDFYSVPYMEVIATESDGGWIGTLGQDLPVVYVDAYKKCWKIADNIHLFLSVTPGWKRELTPCNDVRIYPSLEAAKEELEFIDIRNL